MKMDLKETGCESVDWIQEAYDSVWGGGAVLPTRINLWAPRKVENFLTS